MKRVLALLSAMALVVGCRMQDQNPFAGFGPATIPPPSIEVPPGGSYYTTPTGPSPAPAATPPANSLPSISVPTGGAPAAQPSIPRPYSFGSLAPRTMTPAAQLTPSFATDPSDREPIRVVEASPSAGQFSTAGASRSGSPPSIVEASPAEKQPIRAFTTPSARSSEPVEMSRLPRNNLSPAQPLPPAFGQPPASGAKSSGSFRSDGSVKPAAYQQAVPAFVEPASAGDGQWRSR